MNTLLLTAALVGNATFAEPIQSGNAPSQPSWGPIVAKGRKCLNKNKRELVSAYGEPSEVWVHPQGSGGTYDFIVAGFEISTSFDYQGNVTKVHFDFPKKMTVFASQVWSVVRDGNKAPTMVEPDMENVKQFWSNREMFRRHFDDGRIGTFIGYENRFEHKFGDGVSLTFKAYSPEPPLKGQLRFNPETNQREFAALVKNPAFSWEKATVVKSFRFQSANHK